MKFQAVIKKDRILRDALYLMSSSNMNNYIAGIVVIVDDNSQVIGVLTDGDIRRALARGLDINTKISEIANFSPVTLKENLTKQQMKKEIVLQAKKRNASYKKFQHIIIVDEDNKLVDVRLISSLLDEYVEDKIIAIYGLGFVGLTLAVVMANNGLMIVGVDTNQEVISKLKQGKPSFFENGLESLLMSLQISNPIQFVDNFDAFEADIHIVSVGTPVDENKKPDLTSVKDISKVLARKIKKGDLVVFRSTLPIGTSRNIIIPIIEESGLIAGKDFYISFAPERTVEGNAIEELGKLPQVIGGLDAKSYELTAKLFSKITPTIVEVESIEAAEMIKLINNTYRDLVFAFANEVACVCEQFNINGFKLIEAANEGYPRNRISMPSPGVGGICLSKDPYLYNNIIAETKYRPILGLASRSINEKGHSQVLEKINIFSVRIGKKIEELKIYIIGLSFKGIPETSDVRESTALKLINLLPMKENIRIKDFVVGDEEIIKLGCVPVNDILEGFIQADVVLVMNNHYQNNKFNLQRTIKSMNSPRMVFDGWNMFNQIEIEKIAKTYYATLGYMTAEIKIE